MQAMRAPAATKNGQHVQALKYLENDGGNGSHQFIPEFHEDTSSTRAGPTTASAVDI